MDRIGQTLDLMSMKGFIKNQYLLAAMLRDDIGKVIKEFRVFSGVFRPTFKVYKDDSTTLVYDGPNLMKAIDAYNKINVG